MNQWIMRSEFPKEGAVRLFCLPYVGGGASIFRGWSARMVAGIEVFPIQLPGRENRLAELAFDDLAALVKALGGAIRPYLTTPFALFGHSMGALIAYELARELTAHRGPAPVHLFVSACRAPHLPGREQRRHSLSDAQLISELRRLGGTPDEVLRHPELLQVLLPVLRADFTMIDTYVHDAEPQLDCPVTVFGALQDPSVSREELALWRSVTRAQFDLQVFPGDHFYVRNSPPYLLNAISAKLLDRERLFE
jgi:surfactin synthase thioesterase subunit